MNPDDPEPNPDPNGGGPGEIERLRAEHDRLHQELETIQTRLVDLSTRLDSLSKPKPRQVKPRKRVAKAPTDDESLHATAEPAAKAPAEDAPQQTVAESVPAPEPAPVVDPAPAPKAESTPPPVPEVTPAREEKLAKEETPKDPAPTAPATEKVPHGEVPAPATPSPEPTRAEQFVDAMAAPKGEPAVAATRTEEPTPPEARAGAAPAATPPPVPEEESFEIRWIPYLIILALVLVALLFLVFAGNYVYNEFIVDWGPGMKVTLLYGLCAASLGVGLWMETFRSRLSQLGTALGVIGLGGLYYVTFAAHYSENLRVIESPGLAGFLLMAWAALAFFLAERRKSESLAIISVALAYFSTAIGPVGWFATGSNLFLAVIAVVLQLRHRWYVLGVISLAGIYTSFLCNTILGVSLIDGADPLAALAAAPGEAFLLGTLSLTAYWITFTAAAFLTKDETLPADQRLGFLTANNLLWIGLGWLLMARLDLLTYNGETMLVSGVLLLGAFAVAQWLLEVARPTANAYLAQGLAAFTAGLILTFSGTTQALVLAVELLVVLVIATSTGHRLLRHATLVIAPLVTWTALMSLELGEIETWASMSVSAMLIFAGWWAKFHRASTSWRQEQVDWLTANGLGLLTCAIVTHFEGTPRVLLMTAEFVFVLLFAVSSTSYLLRVTSHMLAVIVLTLAGGYLFIGGPDYVIIISTVSLFWGAWWAQHQTLARHRWTPADIGWLSALALGLFYHWLKDYVPAAYFWPLLGSLSLVAVLTMRLHRIPTMTYLSQIYYLLAVTNILGPLSQYAAGEPGNLPGWQPAVLVGVGLLLSGWWQRTRDLRNDDFSLAMRLIIAAGVVVMLYLWVEPRVDDDAWMLLASGLTLALSAYGVWRREWMLAALGQGLVLVAVGELFFRVGTTVSWPAALVPAATMVGLAMAAEWMANHRFARENGISDQGRAMRSRLIRYAATAYRMVVFFLVVRLVNVFVPLEQQGWVYTVLGFALLGLNGWRMHNLRFLGVALYFCIPMAHWFIPRVPESYLYWQNWAALALILTAPLLTRHARENLPALDRDADMMRRERRDWEEGAIFFVRLAGVLVLWLQVSRLIPHWFGPEYLTIAWALTALLVLGGGFLVRERLLRWMGLAILACTLVRFVGYDVWGFNELFRVISAGVLVVILFLLAFLYLRFAEQIKKWL